jgi:hypothetical protein
MLPDPTGPETYGPPLVDYDEVVDPTTEISSTKMEAWAVDTAAMTHVVPRAWAYITGGATPVVTDHDAVWGDTNAVKPTVSRSGAGIFVVTWAATYDDLNPTTARKVSRSVSIRTAHAVVNAKATTAYPIQVGLTSANSVTVTIGTGASVDDSAFTVWIY